MFIPLQNTPWDGLLHLKMSEQRKKQPGRHKITREIAEVNVQCENPTGFTQDG